MLTDRQRNTFERRIRAAFAEAGDGQADALLRLLGSPPDLGRVPVAFWMERGGALMAAIEPVLVEMAVASATQLARDQGAYGAVNWELVNRRAAQWAERYSFHLVNGIDANSRTRLQKLVTGFITDNTTDLGMLSESIGKLFGPERGKIIAITETTRAAAEGEAALVAEIRAANPSVQVIEVWLTNNDEFTCPVCEPRHGKRRGKDWTDPPPAHPGCRCAAGTEFLGIEKGEPDNG